MDRANAAKIGCLFISILLDGAYHKAAALAHAGEFGQMAALRGDDIVAVSLEEATAQLKTVPPEWYAVAQAFFG